METGSLPDDVVEDGGGEVEDSGNVVTLDSGGAVEVSEELGSEVMVTAGPSADTQT